MKNKLLNKCGQGCALYIAQQKTCQIMPNLAGRIKEDDYCSQWRDHVDQCEICHAGLLYPIITIDENKVAHYYCENCICNLVF